MSILQAASTEDEEPSAPEEEAVPAEEPAPFNNDGKMWQISLSFQKFIKAWRLKNAMTIIMSHFAG